jgi:NTE family protein
VTREPFLIDLALPGGGSHGAFTRGVLDRLLEESWIEVDGISGTSQRRSAAAKFLDAHGDALGRRSTPPIAQLLDGV